MSSIGDALTDKQEWGRFLAHFVAVAIIIGPIAVWGASKIAEGVAREAAEEVQKDVRSIKDDMTAVKTQQAVLRTEVEHLKKEQADANKKLDQLLELQIESMRNNGQ